MSGITMRDIGRQLGVSAVTVSKALAGKSGVNEEMRQKIIRRASELGYVNPNAPQATPTSGLDVGILIPENFFSVVSFYATFYKQLVQALTDAGHFGIMELVTHDMQTALTLPNLPAFAPRRCAHLSGAADFPVYAAADAAGNARHLSGLPRPLCHH